MILTLLGIISVLLNLVLVYTTLNLLKKNELAEEYIHNSFAAASGTLENMRELDTAGAFESDDETGAVFQSLKNLVEDYADFIGIEGVDEEVE